MSTHTQYANLTELHALTQATRSYALLLPAIRYSLGGMNAGGNKLTVSVQEPTKTDEHWIGRRRLQPPLVSSPNLI